MPCRLLLRWWAKLGQHLRVRGRRLCCRLLARWMATVRRRWAWRWGAPGGCGCWEVVAGRVAPKGATPGPPPQEEHLPGVQGGGVVVQLD